MSALRKTGIDVLGDIPWGSHFCYFYQTTQDLLDTLVPYFVAGLKSNEFCLWIISDSELLTLQEANMALNQALPDLELYLAKGSLEIVTHNEWFLMGQTFDLHRVARRFKEKLDEAIARGYAGMRVNGSPAWLQQEDKKQFCEFEEELNQLFPKESIIASCTFPLSTITGDDIFDVMQRHQFAIARRHGQWEVIETPGLIQAKSKIMRLNEKLEQNIVERTQQLAKVIEELKYEITERKKSEDELRSAYQRLSYHVENTPLAVIELDKDLYITRWSKGAEKIFGWKGSEVLGKNVYDPDFPIIYEEDKQAVDKINEQLMKGIVNSNLSLNRNYTKDRNLIYCEWYNSVLKDESGNVITILSLVHNVTERKKAEETLNQSFIEIRRLTEHQQKIREEERAHIAREVHDELGQQLTALKMDVMGLNKKLNDPDDAIKHQIRDILDLLDTSVKSVRKISSELRPSLLHNIGLVAAMEWHLKEFEKRSGIKIVFNEPKEELKMSDSIKNGLFRIFQESLTNISRHANATKVNVTLYQKGEQLVLNMEDNGQGYEKEKIAVLETLGILGMKERSEMMGGNFEISSIPGEGTIVTVVVPVERKG
ncbi:MAG TPA: MEDS domain-containing protein [Puia sp.]|nr:MEDS domain-containing protein [Puia sp.]